MAYSEIRKEAQMVVVADQGESTGDRITVGFKRPATVLGFGLTVIAAYATETTNMVVALDHDPAGASARVEKATLAIPDDAILGATYEVSDLMRGRSPVAPDAVMAAFDVSPGDLVMFEVKTANSAGAGEFLGYILWAPRGSA